MFFLSKCLCFNVYYESILFWFGLEAVFDCCPAYNRKIKKGWFFLPTSDQSVMKNDPCMQLRLNFQKKIAETTWKSEHFRVIGLRDCLLYMKSGTGRFCLAFADLSLPGGGGDNKKKWEDFCPPFLSMELLKWFHNFLPLIKIVDKTSTLPNSYSTLSFLVLC